jgi:hypothetical protein
VTFVVSAAIAKAAAKTAKCLFEKGGGFSVNVIVLL